MKLHRSILLVCSFIFLLTSCITVQPVEFRKLDNFRGEFSLDDPKANFDLVIYNPNKYGVQLTELTTDLKLNGKSAGHFILPSKTKIERKKESTVPIEMKINGENLMNLLRLSATALLERKMDAKLEGYIRLKKFIFKKKVPFTFSQKITL